MAIDQDDVVKILKLMDESDFDELHLEMGDLKLTVTKNGTGGLYPVREQASPPPMETKRPSATSSPASVPAPPKVQPAAAVKAAPEIPVQTVVADGLIPIKSPMLGCFYLQPKPGSPSFVEIGSKVGADDSVCLIEVMKTFTTIKAGVKGRIAKICAENAQMVEYQETLFLVEPD
jgi:acetyl-CoA carboxylase biotin carboxyl carrier protein